MTSFALMCLTFRLAFLPAQDGNTTPVESASPYLSVPVRKLHHFPAADAALPTPDACPKLLPGTLRLGRGVCIGQRPVRCRILSRGESVCASWRTTASVIGYRAPVENSGKINGFPPTREQRHLRFFVIPAQAGIHSAFTEHGCGRRGAPRVPDARTGCLTRWSKKSRAARFDPEAAGRPATRQSPAPRRRPPRSPPAPRGAAPSAHPPNRVRRRRPATARR